jgi:hypothetical protein
VRGGLVDGWIVVGELAGKVARGVVAGVIDWPGTLTLWLGFWLYRTYIVGVYLSLALGC